MLLFVAVETENGIKGSSSRLIDRAFLSFQRNYDKFLLWEGVWQSARASGKYLPACHSEGAPRPKRSRPFAFGLRVTKTTFRQNLSLEGALTCLSFSLKELRHPGFVVA